MTAGCVVPRGDVLELIDDIKDAIPGEAGRCPGRGMPATACREAKEHAETTVASADTEAESLLSHARAEADRVLADASHRRLTGWSPRRVHSESMVSGPREESVRLATAAKRGYEAATTRAKAEADRWWRTATSPTRTPFRKASGTAAPGLGDRGGPVGQRRGRPA